MSRKASSSNNNEKPSSTKKKTGLVSSLYNNSIQAKQIVTEKELLNKYENGVPIKPEDVLKLDKYTESKF